MANYKFLVALFFVLKVFNYKISIMLLVFIIFASEKQNSKSKMIQKLQQIAEQLNTIGREMREEEKVYEAELKDRQAKGLQGEAAIKHYNEWMKAAGMEYLMTD